MNYDYGAESDFAFCDSGGPEMSEQPENTAVYSDAAVLADIGEAYFRGMGMNRDYDKAFIYFRKAADMGDAMALSRLGTCYEKGYGTQIDMAEAMNCYEDAADQNDITAFFKLGDFYFDGVADLVQKDPARAYECYLSGLMSAYIADDSWTLPDIQLRIAKCLEQGIGVGKDLKQAYEMYIEATQGYLDRMDSGDVECEEELDYAEDKVLYLEKLLSGKN